MKPKNLTKYCIAGFFVCVLLGACIRGKQKDTVVETEEVQLKEGVGGDNNSHFLGEKRVEPTNFGNASFARTKDKEITLPKTSQLMDALGKQPRHRPNSKKKFPQSNEMKPMPSNYKKNAEELNSLLDSMLNSTQLEGDEKKKKEKKKDGAKPKAEKGTQELAVEQGKQNKWSNPDSGKKIAEGMPSKKRNRHKNRLHYITLNDPQLPISKDEQKIIDQLEDADAHEYKKIMDGIAPNKLITSEESIKYKRIADALYRNGKKQRAKDIYEKLIKVRPEFSESIGHQFLQDGDVPNAVHFYKTLIRYFPDRVVACLDRLYNINEENAAYSLAAFAFEFHPNAYLWLKGKSEIAANAYLENTANQWIGSPEEEFMQNIAVKLIVAGLYPTQHYIDAMNMRFQGILKNKGVIKKS